MRRIRKKDWKPHAIRDPEIRVILVYNRHGDDPKSVNPRKFWHEVRKALSDGKSASSVILLKKAKKEQKAGPWDGIREKGTR